MNRKMRFYNQWELAKSMLLYAKTQEQIVPNNMVISNDGNVFYFKTLDLNQNFKEIRKQLDHLVNI
jgi:5-methylcytosine-specific restriction enzyme subunit McrC